MDPWRGGLSHTRGSVAVVGGHLPSPCGRRWLAQPMLGGAEWFFNTCLTHGTEASSHHIVPDAI